MIEVKNLQKIFKQNTASGGLIKTLLGRVPSEQVTALSDLSFSVDEGHFYSLLGRNGAGKTTAIKILCTLLLPDSGSASVAGFDVDRDSVEVRKNIGVSIRGERSVYWRLSGRQNLEYFGQLYDLSGSELKQRVSEVGEVIGLSDRLDDYVERYSMGMKQRLAIGCALIHRPRVLMLDEPTIGLDAASARNLRQFISQELRDREKVTILYTTHYMHEAEEMSDRIGILHDGKLVAEGTPREITGMVSAENVLEMTVRPLVEGIEKRISTLDSVDTVTVTDSGDGRGRVRVTSREALPVAAVSGSLTGLDTEIESFELMRPSLEDAFVALTGGLTGAEID